MGRPGHTAGLHGLEQQIERHHLGQRGRIADGIAGRLIKHPAVIGIDDDCRVLRRGIGRGRDRSWSKVLGRRAAAGGDRQKQDDGRRRKALHGFRTAACKNVALNSTY